MGTKRLVGLLTLVAILGLVAIWNIKTVQNNQMMEIGQPSSGGDLDILPADDTRVDVQDEVTPTTATERPTAVVAETSTGTPAAAGTLEAEVQALDRLYDEQYDDSSLETTFSADGATRLSEPYDI